MFQHILVTDRNVLSMLKTFGLHSKWRNIERHWKCILTALWLLSKYSYIIPTAFHTFWSYSRKNLLYRRCCGVFSWFRRRDINDYTFLLTYPWSHFLQQLIKHGRLHPELVVERLCVFCSELIHQSGVMSIQPPPLLCQPWMGLIFSGSFPPLFSWPPPHLFQADLAVK